ncbi:hypothetical protein Tco_1291812 [Tanacetum coccineum]
MREDGWFVVPLYHFTSQQKTADLQFEFEKRAWDMRLVVAGIEFQPFEEKVEFQEYQDIVEIASHPLFYTSLDELKQILSKGVHLNGYKTWFSINDKEEHCHMISMEDCLIPNEDFPSRYKFPAGLYQTNNKGFKTHVKTQLLSPSITYTVNLFFYGESDIQVYIDLKYRLRGEPTTSTVYLAKRRDDGPFYMAELYQFTSDGRIVDLEIIFENSGTIIDGVEGILFQPLEKNGKKNKRLCIEELTNQCQDTLCEPSHPSIDNAPHQGRKLVLLSIDAHSFNGVCWTYNCYDTKAPHSVYWNRSLGFSDTVNKSGGLHTSDRGGMPYRVMIIKPQNVQQAYGGAIFCHLPSEGLPKGTSHQFNMKIIRLELCLMNLAWKSSLNFTKDLAKMIMLGPSVSSYLLAEIDKKNLNPLKQMRAIEQGCWFRRKTDSETSPKKESMKKAFQDMLHGLGEVNLTHTDYNSS